MLHVYTNFHGARKKKFKCLQIEGCWFRGMHGHSQAYGNDHPWILLSLMFLHPLPKKTSPKKILIHFLLLDLSAIHNSKVLPLIHKKLIFSSRKVAWVSQFQKKSKTQEESHERAKSLTLATKDGTCQKKTAARKRNF